MKLKIKEEERKGTLIFCSFKLEKYRDTKFSNLV